MKPAKTYENVIKRFYRPEIYKCPECQQSIKRALTVSQRTVVTLNGVIKMTHGGYRCLNPECRLRGRTYRSAAADALVLPRMVFGLDIVLLVGKLRLEKHQTLDETHQELVARLAPLGTSISRREVMYLFDAFCHVLRASSDCKEDKEWLAEVKKNRGIIVSIDGIKPDNGNETVYLVRDALTGRMINAENVIESSVKRLKQVLGPVLDLNVPVLGTISDAQESEVIALQELWPDVPHQTCQFHALEKASEPGFKEDGRYMREMRGEMMESVIAIRKQIRRQKQEASEEEAEQLDVLGDYALGVQTALSQKGKVPFDYAGIEASEALDDVASKLETLKKKGDPVGKVVKRKADRLKQILEKREKFREQIEQVKRMHQWVVDAEHVLDGSWNVQPEESGLSEEMNKKRRVTNKEVGERFDRFLGDLGQKLVKEEMSQTERTCLTEFLRVLNNLRPNLIQCYDQEKFPRTNNDMEGTIRKIKTRYRRISGRKDWNTYLLRHGRDVAFFEWWNTKSERWQTFEKLAKKLDRAYWKRMRQETLSSQSEQLKRFRFLHQREKFFATLEDRWAAASKTASLH